MQHHLVRAHAVSHAERLFKAHANDFADGGIDVVQVHAQERTVNTQTAFVVGPQQLFDAVGHLL